jgi:hypothetical protein
MLTRGQFHHTASEIRGIEADENAVDNFSDAGSTYYTAIWRLPSGSASRRGGRQQLPAPEQALYPAGDVHAAVSRPQGAWPLRRAIPARGLSDFFDSGSIAPMHRRP